MFDQWDSFLNEINIGLLKNNFLAGPLAARLLAGLLGPADDSAFPKRIEAIDENRPEAVAVGDQQRDRGNSPDDSEHRQSTARAVALQRDPGFVDEFGQH